MAQGAWRDGFEYYILILRLILLNLEYFSGSELLRHLKRRLNQ